MLYNMAEKVSQYYVIKRDGRKQPVHFDKITQRIYKLLDGKMAKNIDVIDIVKKTITSIYPGISTVELDNQSAYQCAMLTTKHYDYAMLAGRIYVSSLHKETAKTFVEKMEFIQDKLNLYDETWMEFIKKYKNKLNKAIDYNRDYQLDFFGVKTMERTYITKYKDQLIERPQDVFMRVASLVHCGDLRKTIESYNLMSKKYFTHASPTLFNAGNKYGNLVSCFLLGTEDSISGITKTWSNVSHISKWGGGIGIHVSNIRAKGSSIRGTNGHSDGIIPMLQVYNSICRYVNQCFTPDTPIFTDNGFVNIEDIKENTNVMTSDGSFRNVNRVFKNEVDKSILKIRVKQSFEDIKCTEEHDILALQNVPKGLNFKHIKNRLKLGKYKPSFVKSSTLKVGDFMVIPKITVNKETTFSKDEYYFLGLFLGDGHMSKRKNSRSIECGISLSDTTKVDCQKFIKEYLNKKEIHTYDSKGTGCTTIKWVCSDKFFLNYDDIYDENKEKILNDRFITGNKTKLLQLLKGLLDSDGHIGKEIYFNTTSKKLAYSTRYILMLLNIMSSGHIADRIGEVSSYRNITTRKLKYVIRIPKVEDICKMYNIEHYNKFSFVECEKYFLSRIISIDKEDYKGFVYDLNIEENHNYLTSSGIVHNSGRRRGSFAIYLEPHHADVFDFLELRKNTGAESERARDLFLALWVPDLFMKQVKSNGDWYLFCPDKAPRLNDVYGEEYETLYWKYVEEEKYNEKVPARKLWDAIMTSQFETGSPYMAYKDNINNKSNQKNIGIIRSSNLCVAPETQILTKSGYKVISELKNKKCEVWNGKEWSEVEVKQTGKNQELCKVIFDDYTELECTPYHKFYIQESYHGKPVIKEAKDLKENDKIIKCNYPIIDNKNVLKSAYTNGFFSGDGTYNNITKSKPRKCTYKSVSGKAYCKRHMSYQKEDEKSEKCCGISYTKKPHLTLYHEKIKLLEHLDYLSKGEVKDNKLNLTLRPNDIKEKFFVPHNYSINSKLDWFAGYCDADGTITTNKGCQSLQISCIELDFLKDIKLMLNTCGINPKISLLSKKKKTLLPDGRGGEKLYDTKESYRLLINSGDLNKLIELGFNPKRLILNRVHKPNRDARKFTKIKKLEITNRVDDTYCFTEEKEHKGIFNGVITGQCCEIVEFSDSNETAACNLASIALSNLVKSKNIETEKWKIYSKKDCPYCKWAKSLLTNKNISFEEILVEPGDDNYKKLKEQLVDPLDKITFPKIYQDTKLIGGMEDLYVYLGKDFDYEKLWEISYHVTQNLDKVIDKNYYPTVEARRSNMKHRPIGLGIQGLADTLAMMRIPYASKEMVEINEKIFGVLYHASLQASVDISKEREESFTLLQEYFKEHPKKKPTGEFYNEKFECYPKKIEKIYHKLRPHSTELNKTKFLGSYSTFEGSPYSEGKLQYHLWDRKPINISELVEGKSWDSLIEEIKKYGTRNSLLTALMPTASTSQLLGNFESFEAFTSNMYTRRTLAGEFIVVNKHLINDLTEIGEWNENAKNNVIVNNGSVQGLKIPKIIKDNYLTAYEIKQKYIIDGCVARGAYIDQTQSMNLYFAQPDSRKLTSSQFYAWEKGLKTGLYYLRSKPSANATKITAEDEGCLMCSA